MIRFSPLFGILEFLAIWELGVHFFSVPAVFNEYTGRIRESFKARGVLAMD